MADIVPYLEQICARFSLPEKQAEFRGFAKTMQFTFPDLRRDFTLTIAEDGSATLAEHKASRPDVTVTTSSDILVGILNRTINPVQVYVMRKLKVVGRMEDLLRLQKLL